MDKTIDEIAAEIEAAKLAEPSLSGLTSVSNASLWHGLKTVVATAAYACYAALDSLKVEIADMLVRGRFGTLPWLVAQSKLWQNGDSLAVDPLNYGYSYDTVDVSKQLVVLASATEVPGGVILRVAKVGAVPLTVGEKSSFDTYISKIKVPGQYISIISAEPDELYYQMKVYYDGTMTSTAVQAAVYANTQVYLASLDFSGELQKSSLIDTVQEVPGVRDVELVNLMAKPEGASYVQVDRVYSSYAGTFNLAPLGSGALECRIVMIAV